MKIKQEGEDEVDFNDCPRYEIAGTSQAYRARLEKTLAGHVKADEDNHKEAHKNITELTESVKALLEDKKYRDIKKDKREAFISRVYSGGVKTVEKEIVKIISYYTL